MVEKKQQIKWGTSIM